MGVKRFRVSSEKIYKIMAQYSRMEVASVMEKDGMVPLFFHTDNYRE